MLSLQTLSTRRTPYIRNVRVSKMAGITSHRFQPDRQEAESQKKMMVRAEKVRNTARSSAAIALGQTHTHVEMALLLVGMMQKRGL